MSLRTAAQQALEALEGWANHGKWVWPESALETCKRNTVEALDALRAALAQPEQEPVAWRFQSPLSEEGQWEYGKEPPVGSRWAIEPLYTHPPRREWRGLTEEERDAVIRWAVDQEDTHFSRTVARAVEAKLKEKNQ
jgi:hypothetical protein